MGSFCRKLKEKLQEDQEEGRHNWEEEKTKVAFCIVSFWVLALFLQLLG
jgi:hypothetical protein